ncbi:hypothetical protein [Fodinicurvata halophila]|uniref:hypothetical protein n=1 Tax=Fodinicurvata halophila TaxID=1419723 RepID=UPI00363B920C
MLHRSPEGGVAVGRKRLQAFVHHAGIGHRHVAQGHDGRQNQQQHEGKHEDRQLGQAQGDQQQHAQNRVVDEDVPPVEEGRVDQAEAQQHEKSPQVERQEGPLASETAVEEQGEAEPEEKREGRKRLALDQDGQGGGGQAVRPALDRRQGFRVQEIQAADAANVDDQDTQQGDGAQRVHGDQSPTAFADRLSGFSARELEASCI